jgi:hypothetical protein
MGFFNPSVISDLVILGPLRDYYSIMFDDHYNVIEGSFHFIVDTGCSTSASPHKEDFSKLWELPRPITLHGITENSSVTHGGALEFLCINSPS